jgi:hypothetical protein
MKTIELIIRVLFAATRAAATEAKRYKRTPPNPAAEARYREASKHVPSREAPWLPPPHCIFCGVRLSALNEDEHCTGPHA